MKLQLRHHASIVSIGLCLLGFATRSSGSSVNVALEASFYAGPYLLELLETAAEENQTSYLPLLDRIADGYFDDAVSEKELYDRFLKVLVTDGHLLDADATSSFNFALALHAAAPRIEAQYQYYETSVETSFVDAQDAVCPIWVYFDGKQYCSPSLERAQQDMLAKHGDDHLAFDRELFDGDSPIATLYADIASPGFGDFHISLKSLADQGKLKYRLRYRRSTSRSSRPLYLNGYGVELALKRTDYIVIDDRQASNTEGAKSEPVVGLTEDVPADIQPLSKSELLNIGINAASFVMNSDDPLSTLLALLNDFPRQSSAIASFSATPEFTSEFRYNRKIFLPAGYNTVWINGLQVESRDMNAFSLLETLKRERKLMKRFQDLELSTAEAVDILSHPLVALSQDDDATQRYDYRDSHEGGNVILWLNDIEKDSRYEGWPTSLRTLLQRTYPGQMPAVRRDIQNVVMPLDFANPNDIEIVLEPLQSFIKRKIPVRFGIVPTLKSEASVLQAKVAYYLVETHGLGVYMRYLEEITKAKTSAETMTLAFTKATTDAKLRRGKSALMFDDINASEQSEAAISRLKSYLKRLGAQNDSPPLFVNGAALSRDENWLQSMSTRISIDLSSIQRGVMEELFDETSWLPDYFLLESALSRVPLVSPENPKDIKVSDLVEIEQDYSDILNDLPRLEALVSGDEQQLSHMIALADFDSSEGLDLITHAIGFQASHPGVELVLMHNPSSDVLSTSASARVYELLRKGIKLTTETLVQSLEGSSGQVADMSEAMARRTSEYWKSTRRLADRLGFGQGEMGLVLNGRLVGPIPPTTNFGPDEYAALWHFESSRLILPVSRALESLSMTSKISDPFKFAKLVCLIARSTITDVPEDMFDIKSSGRINKAREWQDRHSAIKSSCANASIQIVAAIDPISEAAQRWVPILQVLSELSGVDLKIFMNPAERISEIPIKRFYRHVLESRPSFDKAGTLDIPKARFDTIPRDTLLNLAMDVPPSWLVSPKDSIHDLDNIKLANLDSTTDVDAVYELESILIEGHSRDSVTKQPPRGVQLILGTEKNPHHADTIIMANLGYFQFKANPGYWKIDLKPGRSQDIYNLDSIGGSGYTPEGDDDTNEVALFSFLGRTLFPRLSRKPGQEAEDVLEISPPTGSVLSYMSKGIQFTMGKLADAGVSIDPAKGVEAINKIYRRLGVWKSALGLADQIEAHADVNIFSVASGHLYERMLNIMMVSVMKNTHHSVKFWFIEQFLSPSFKNLLPHIAQEYGFTYEMVTYKWPHWLRAQKEKQREIWGYKILFLDVLFPLSLDKVIFVDADQIVRTDMFDLVQTDLEGAPYGFTPMGDSREEMEGFRFWKQGYWKNFLRGLPYHISALYVVDLNRFRQIAAGDRLRQQYQMLSADKDSLSNLDQDLPNHMQHVLPIKSLDPSWLWCETWCADSDLATARTIDLCNNPLTKEPKLDRARRQVPEWNVYDAEIAKIAHRSDDDSSMEAHGKHDEL